MCGWWGLYAIFAGIVCRHRRGGGGVYCAGRAGGRRAGRSVVPAAGPRFVATLAVAAVGAILGRRLHIPSGPLLLPMVAGATLHATGTLTLQVPEWLQALALAYAFIGWSVGLRFTRAIVLLALKTLPHMLASIAGMMLLCGLLTKLLPVDLLTAYLATSPGGLDTVAIIAAGSQVNIGFVMAMQSLRLFAILLVGPAMARFISRTSVRRQTSQSRG